MNPRIILLAVAALVVAGLTAFLARQFLLDSTTTDTQPVAVESEVLVAARNLPQGHIVVEGDFRWAPWPEANRPPNYIVRGGENANPRNLWGQVVRYGIVAGEPIVRGRIVGPGQRGYLAAVLSEGMRAITIPIGNISGIAGFVFPGDRVDVMLTRAARDNRGTLHQVSETVLKNVRVLAVDRRVNDQAKGNPQVGSTVTIEVTPKIAEKVTILRRLGRISLVLRSLRFDENGEVEIMDPSDDLPISTEQTLTWDAEVSLLSPPVNPPVQRFSVTRGRSTQVFVRRGSEVVDLEDPPADEEEGDEGEEAPVQGDAIIQDINDDGFGNDFFNDGDEGGS